MRLAVWSPRMTGYSGVELYTMDLALALARAGHAVSAHASVWEDHLATPMRQGGVDCRDLESFPEGIEINVAPKYGPYKAAAVTNRPILQVLHSEHLTDVPMKYPVVPAGVVMIRKGQRWLVDAEVWARDIPRRVIRNPVDRARFGPGDTPVAARPYACAMLSEFDDMKAELAHDVAHQFEGKTLLVGPWRSELPVPTRCVHEQPTMDAASVYARARSAFSYRLSRQYAEAVWSGVPVLVRGELEPAQVTRHDQDGVWSTHDPAMPEVKALAGEFDADHVAAQVVEFAAEVLGR